MVGELAGQGKKNESVLGLVRARKFLQRRFGSVCVSFGEPLSLAGALGRRRERLAGAESPEVVGELRSFVEALANRIVERINWASVVNSTSVAACALLGESRRGLFRAQLTRRMQQIVDLLRLQDVPLSPAIQRDEGEFSEAIGFLLRSDLIRTVKDERGEILYFDESRRRALDLYRNAIVHYLAAPSFLARRLLSGASAAELREDLAGWLDLFYLEFFVPRAETLEDRLEIFLDHFERAGWIERGEWRVRGTEKGAKDLRFLAAQTRSWLEAYFATCQAVLASRGEGAAKELAGRAKEQFERAELLGEVQRPEAANPVTFDNALDLLVRRGVLVRPPAEGSSRDRAYRPGPEFDSLLALRDRLATALAAG